MFKDFLKFIEEYKVMGLAIAFVMGSASTTLIQSLAQNIIMPIFSPILTAGKWENAQLVLGPVILRWGAFAGDLLNFLIMAFVIFLITKKIVRDSEAAKKQV